MYSLEEVIGKRKKVAKECDIRETSAQVSKRIIDLVSLTLREALSFLVCREEEKEKILLILEDNLF